MSSKFIYTQPDVSQGDFDDYIPLEHYEWYQPFSCSDPAASSWMPDETCPETPQTTEAADFTDVLNELISPGMQLWTQYFANLSKFADRPGRLRTEPKFGRASARCHLQ